MIDQTTQPHQHIPVPSDIARVDLHPIWILTVFRPAFFILPHELSDLPNAHQSVYLRFEIRISDPFVPVFPDLS